MSVFSKIKDIFSRHRNAFVVTGVIIGGTIFLTRYAQQQLKEWQEKQTLEFLEINRKKQHFDSIGRNCNQTIVNLSKALNDKITKTLDNEQVILNIQKNPENKLELWNELKVLVFCKSACMMYSTVMLVVTLKIQLSIIGGYLYKDVNSLPSDIQEKYLSLCENLMNSSFIRLHKLIEKVCKQVLGSIDLKKQVRISDLEAIFWSIQTGVSTDDDNPIDKLREYVITELPEVNGNYEKVIKDTVDLLDSDEVKSLITHCVNRGFILLGEQLSEFYTSGNEKITGEFTNPYTTKKHIVKLLPIINSLLMKKFPEQFLQQLISYEKLLALSANVYECLL